VVPVNTAYCLKTSLGFGPNIINTSIIPLSEMEIGWTDVGSGGYILVSCAHSNTSCFFVEFFLEGG
jgi:hypothetical protein